MTYWFSQEADTSLGSFSQEVKAAIIDELDDADKEGFYNHDAYSFIYDHHGDPWDKLDLKEGSLNHRVFFIKDGNDYVIIDIFDRNNLDYEEKGFYNQLRRIADRNGL